MSDNENEKWYTIIWLLGCGQKKLKHTYINKKTFLVRRSGSHKILKMTKVHIYLLKQKKTLQYLVINLLLLFVHWNSQIFNCNFIS